MRLNRNSLVFLAVLMLVIVVAFIFLNTPDGFGTSVPTAAPTSSTVNIFPGVQPTTITSLAISSQIPLGDTRATPIPGNPPLATLTPLPLGAEGPAETKSLVLQYNASGVWTLGQGGTVSSTEPIMQQTVTTALTTLAGLRSSQQFIPADGNYAQYGLDTPNHDITFVVQLPASTDATGQAIVTPPVTHRLRLGNRSVDNTQFFAFLDSDETTVYVILGAGALDTSVLRMVTQPPFTPAPTATPAPVLNVPGLPFISFNYNLAASFTVTDHQNGTAIVLSKLPDNVTWAVELIDASALASPTPELTAEATAESTAEATAEATVDVSSLLGPQVDQLRVATYLTEFGYISGVSRTTVADLSTLGLTSPHYTIQAVMGDGSRYTIRIGNTDPTGTLYYALINDFTDVVLVEAGTVAPLLDLLVNPPYMVELTPEATAAALAPIEATAEATAETTEAAGN